MNKNKLHVTNYTAETLEQETAKFLVEKITEMVKKNDRNLLLLSGGSLVKVYKLMADILPSYLDLNGLVIGLTDERDVEHGSIESNEVQIFESGLLTKLKDKGASFVGILSDSFDEANKKETYIEIRNNQYKCMFLESDEVLGVFGIGEDGHTAGILPMKDHHRFNKLFEASDYLVGYKIDSADSDNPHPNRVTLTISGIKQIDNAILYAKGDTKLKSLYQLVEKHPGNINQIPVKSLESVRGQVEILTDQELD